MASRAELGEPTQKPSLWRPSVYPRDAFAGEFPRLLKAGLFETAFVELLQPRLEFTRVAEDAAVLWPLHAVAYG